jgi:hypothetical protein
VVLHDGGRSVGLAADLGAGARRMSCMTRRCSIALAALGTLDGALEFTPDRGRFHWEEVSTMRLRRAAARITAACVAAAAVATAGCATSSQPTGPAQDSTPARRTHTAAGISVATPRGWQLTRPPITAVTYPAERLLLTSFRTARGGNCAPDRAARDLPADGALVYLFEYRRPRGDPWRGLRRRSFPPRPAHFALRRSDRGNFECWRVPTYLLRFRAADRPFQLHVALGAKAGAARRTQVLRILDSLRFASR